MTLGVYPPGCQLRLLYRIARVSRTPPAATPHPSSYSAISHSYAVYIYTNRREYSISVFFIPCVHEDPTILLLGRKSLNNRKNKHRRGKRKLFDLCFQIAGEIFLSLSLLLWRKIENWTGFMETKNIFGLREEKMWWGKRE